MAATSEPSTGNTASLPVVDLRLVSQPELFTLSFSHDTGRNRRIDDDSVIPRIDRSVFNESAGSRKQTFSRLNFRNNNNNNPNYSVPVAPVVPAPESSSSHIAVDEENSQIIDLLQRLFGVEALRGANDDRLVPFQGEFKQPAIEFTRQGFQSVAIGGVDGSQRKRKRGRPRRDESSVTETSLVVVGDGDVEMVEAVNEQKVETANKKNDFVLEDAGDPFVEELIVRTQGMNTEAQLSEFLEGLNGVWASDRKKRRIVDANIICDLLPTEWKLILILQRRGARNSVVCRRYVSPDGRQFESYKEVSSYLDGSQQFSNNINMASENQNVGHVPIGGIKIDDNASSRHEKQATVSSSIETGKRNTSDGCLNGDRAMDFELGDTTSGAFGVSDHPADDKLQLKANKNDANSDQGCSLSEDRVYNQSAGHILTGGMKIDANASSHKKKQATMSSSIGTAKLNSSNRKPDRILVLGLKAIDVACKPRISSDFRAPISNSSCSINRFSDERCLKGGVSIIDGQDKSTGCYETAPNGNERVPVGGHRLGFSTTLIENHLQNIDSENSMLAPNSEGKNDGKLVKEDDSQQIISSTYLSEIQDISTNGKLQFGSEGSLVPSQNGLNHTSTDNMNNGQTSMLNDSAEGNFFFDDIPSSSIDERTWDPNGYINDISFSAWPQDTSESGGVDFTPIPYVADNVGHNHVPPMDEVVTSCLQKSSMNDQILTMDNLLHRNSESSLFTVTGDHHPSAFHDNMNNISAGTFGALKHVDDGCMKPQSGIVSCSDVVAIDAYASPRPQSVPSDGSLLNQFDKQNDDGVNNNGNKSFLSEMAKNEVEIFPTDLMGMPKFQ